MDAGTPDEQVAGAERAIADLLARRAPGLTICPSEAAREIGGENWRACMPAAHHAAERLVDAGAVVLTQGGAVRDPGAIVGAYRIRLR